MPALQLHVRYSFLLFAKSLFSWGCNLRIFSFLISILLGGFIAHGTAQAEERELTEEHLVSEGLILEAMIERAIATHPSILSASASARAAGADFLAAKWQRYPSISVEGLLLNQPGNSMQAQIIIDQPFWTGGRISGSIDRASSRKNAALAAYDEAILAIALSTAEAFFEVHRWHERVVILSQSLAQHNRMVETMERRYTQEVSPLSDLELARSRALQIEQQIYQAQAQEGAASSRLRELVGDPFSKIGDVPEIPKVWPAFAYENLSAEVLAYSPALRRLRYEGQSVGADARIARASIFPHLSGQYSYSDTFGHRIGVVLKAQSDGGFSRFSLADAAMERVRASDLQFLSSERQLRHQTFALLQEYESATARFAGSQAVSGSAQLVMESYMRQFTSGRRTWLDVMNAVRESTTANIDVVEARISAQSSFTKILLLSGKWSARSSMKAEP